MTWFVAELPLVYMQEFGPGRALSFRVVEGSPYRGCAPAAALEFYAFSSFKCPPVQWGLSLFAFLCVFYAAAIASSVCTAMSQINPHSSLAMIVVITCLALPLAQKCR